MDFVVACVDKYSYIIPIKLSLDGLESHTVVIDDTDGASDNLQQRYAICQGTRITASGSIFVVVNVHLDTILA